MPRATPAAILLLAAPALAQCRFDWLPGLPGFNGPVRASLAWDPDGPGPAPEQLVVAGSFTNAGGAPAMYIAAWDGSAWRPLGQGTGQEVRALAVYSGDLVAVLDTCLTMRWDGSTWQPLGRSFCDVPFGPPVYLAAACATRDSLFLGGQFVPSKPGCCTNALLARLNSGTWDLLPTPGASENSWITVLGRYDGDPIAGGFFDLGPSSIARWTGQEWAPLGTGIYGEAASLAVYNGSLIVGGTFWLAGGAPASCIAAWNGSAWSPLGDGIDGWPDPSAQPRVSSLAVYRGDLFAAGRFLRAGGLPCNSIARWDGAWHPVESGITGGADTLTVFNDQLIVAGDFTSAGGQGAMAWARLGCACYANCDASTAPPTLNLADFTCFLDRFATGDTYANCDGSTTSPVLNVLDFSCFLNAFAAGCP